MLPLIVQGDRYSLLTYHDHNIFFPLGSRVPAPSTMSRPGSPASLQTSDADETASIRSIALATGQGGDTVPKPARSLWSWITRRKPSADRGPSTRTYPEGVPPVTVSQSFPPPASSAPSEPHSFISAPLAQWQGTHLAEWVRRYDEQHQQQLSAAYARHQKGMQDRDTEIERLSTELATVKGNRDTEVAQGREDLTKLYNELDDRYAKSEKSCIEVRQAKKRAEASLAHQQTLNKELTQALHAFMSSFGDFQADVNGRVDRFRDLAMRVVTRPPAASQTHSVGPGHSERPEFHTAQARPAPAIHTPVTSYGPFPSTSWNGPSHARVVTPLRGTSPSPSGVAGSFTSGPPPGPVPSTLLVAAH